MIRQLAGRGAEEKTVESARLAVKVNSEIGRTEYLLVGLVETTGEDGVSSLAAYPMGQGSGSVTAFSRGIAIRQPVYGRSSFSAAISSWRMWW